MLEKIIKLMNDELVNIKKKDSLYKLYNHYSLIKEYLVVFTKQYVQMLNNVNSINILLKHSYVEDAFTIFRKFLETFFIVMSVYEHPDITGKYLEHDKQLSNKACRKDMDVVSNFKKGKPNGFLEYGYIEKYIDREDDDFKYTMKDIAIAGNVKKYFYLYSMSNNFVHNNLSLVTLDSSKGSEKLETSIEEIILYLNQKINLIIQ